MEAQYQNDMFVANLVNPNATLTDYAAAGLNNSNTGLLSPDEYKKTNVVKEKYTKDGVFDEDSFNKDYLLAAVKYLQLSSDNSLDNLVKEINYNSNSRFAKFDQIRDDLMQIDKTINPYNTKLGVYDFFEESNPDKSMRELAQMNTHYFDWDKQEWVNESPDNFGISSLWKEPLVYAQWDEDGTHKDPMTGQLLLHHKGDWKTDENGKVYLETLGNRESYGKLVLSAFDTLVSEKSSLQNIAFWESDEDSKSAFGTTLKIAALIAPYFIPGFNEVWGGIHMTLGLASVLPTFYKAAESLIFSGDRDYEDKTDAYKAMTKAESWFLKFLPSLSTEGQQSFWNYELMGLMIGDIFSQIYELRAAGVLATKFINTNKKSEQKVFELIALHEKEAEQFIKTPEDLSTFIKTLYRTSPEMKALALKQSKWAQRMSLGYMALTQSVDVYGDAKLAGYDDRAAGFAALLAAGGLYGLMMNNKLGNWFMYSISGYEELGVNSLIRKALKPYVKEFDDAIKGIDKAVTSKEKSTFLNKFSKATSGAKNAISGLWKNVKYGTEDFWGRAGIEAVEEVTEEAAIDMAKGVTDFLSWAGLWKQNGDFYDEKNPFLSYETFQRYLTSAIGGAVGGALFLLNDKFISPFVNNEVSVPNQRELIELVAGGHTEQIYKTIDSITKASDNNLSSIPLEIKVDGKLQKVFLSDAKNSLGTSLNSLLKNYVKWLDGIMNLEDLKLDDESLFLKAILNEKAIKLFKDSGLEAWVKDDFVTASQLLVEIIGKAQQTGKDEDISSDLRKELFDKRKAIEDIMSGKKAEEYMVLASFVLNPGVKKAFDSLDFDTFVEAYYGKKFSELAETGQGSKEEAKQEWEKFKSSTNWKDYIKTRLEVFKTLEPLLSPKVKEYIDTQYSDVRAQTISKLFDLYTFLRNINRIKFNIEEDQIQALKDLANEENKDEVELLSKKLVESIVNNKDEVLADLDNLYNKIIEDESKKDAATTIYKSILSNINAFKAYLNKLHSEVTAKGKEGVNFDDLLNVDLVKYLDTLITPIRELLLTILTNMYPSKSAEDINADVDSVMDVVEPIINSYTKFSLSNISAESFLAILNTIFGYTDDLGRYIGGELSRLAVEYRKGIDTLTELLAETDALLASDPNNTEAQEKKQELQNKINELTKLTSIALLENSLNVSGTDVVNLLEFTLSEFLKDLTTLDGEIVQRYKKMLIDKMSDFAKHLVKGVFDSQFIPENISQEEEFVKKLQSAETLLRFVDTFKFNVENNVPMLDAFNLAFAELLLNAREYVCHTIKIPISGYDVLNIGDKIAEMDSEIASNFIQTNPDGSTTIKLNSVEDTQLYTTYKCELYALQHYNQSFETLPILEKEKILTDVIKDLPGFPNDLSLDAGEYSEIVLGDYRFLIFAITPDIQLNLFKKFTNKVNEIDQILSKPILPNPLYKLLRELQLRLGDTDRSIFDLITVAQKTVNELLFNLWILSQSDITGIERGIKTIDILEGIISGMIETHQTPDMPFGFNTAMVNYLKKNHEGRGVEKYVIIQNEDAVTILQDLEELKTRLVMMKQVSDSNKQSLLTLHIQSRKAFLTIVAKHLEKEVVLINNINIMEGIHDILTSDIDDEKKLADAEELFFNNFKKAVAGKDLKSSEKQLLDGFGIKINEDFIRKKSLGLDSETKQLSDFDLAIYLITITALNSKDFKEKYLLVLKAELTQSADKKKVPLFGQEYGILVGCAMSENPDAFTAFKTLISESSELTDELKNEVINATSIYYLSAIGGAGKTSTVAKQLFLILTVGKPLTTVEFFAPSEKARLGLIDSIITDPSKVKYTKTGLTLKTLFSTFILNSDDVLKEAAEAQEAFNNSESFNKTYFEVKITEKNKQKSRLLIIKNIKTQKDTPEFLFLDETTNLGSVELALLNYAASEKKTKVFAFGDESQLGKFSTVDDTFTISPIKLSLSLRSTSDVKDDNNKIIHKWILDLISNPVVDEKRNLDSIKDTKYLKYFESDTKLVGEKIVTSITKDQLNVFKTQSSSTSKFIIITKDGKTISKALLDALEETGIESTSYTIMSFNPKDNNSVLGSEADYVIVDSPTYNGNLEDEFIYDAKAFYTSISRSFTGTLIFDPDNSIKKRFNISSLQVASYFNREKLSPETIETELNRRIEILEKILAGRTTSSTTSTTTSTSTPTTPIPTTPTTSVELLEEKPLTLEDLLELELDSTFSATETNDEDSISPEPSIASQFTKASVGKTDPLYVYPFYVHLGKEISYAKNGDPFIKYDASSIMDISIFERPKNGKYSKSDIEDFILIKNLLSLYSKSGIEEILNDSNKKQMYEKALGKLKNPNLVESLGEFKIRAVKYSSLIDDPFFSYEHTRTNKLISGQTFITIVREIKINGKIHYVTIAAFPQISTLLEAKDKNKINLQTFDAFVEFLNKIEEKLKTSGEVILKSPWNFDIPGLPMLLEFLHITGTRVDKKSENDDLTLLNLGLHGLYYELAEIVVLKKPTSEAELEQIIQDFIENQINQNCIKGTDESEEKYLERRQLMYDKLTNPDSGLYRDRFGFKLWGRPIIKLYLTPDNHIDLILYPKNTVIDDSGKEVPRTFNIMLDEVKSKEVNTKGRNATLILSAYDSFVLFYNIINAIHSLVETQFNIDRANTSIIKLLKLFVDELKTKISSNTHPTSDSAYWNATWNATINFLESVQNHIETNGFNFTDFKSFKRAFMDGPTKGPMPLFMQNGAQTFGYEICYFVNNLTMPEHADMSINIDGKMLNYGYFGELIINSVNNHPEYKNKGFYYGKVFDAAEPRGIFNIDINGKHFEIRHTVAMPIVALDMTSLFSGQSTTTTLKVETLKTSLDTKIEEKLESFKTFIDNSKEDLNKVYNAMSDLLEDYPLEEVSLENLGMDIEVLKEFIQSLADFDFELSNNGGIVYNGSEYVDDSMEAFKDAFSKFMQIKLEGDPQYDDKINALIDIYGLIDILKSNNIIKCNN